MKNYSIISHTHWDREWYQPFEQMRIRLVDAIDNLLEILENDENFRFHLDAQTIVLEDYLVIRPERRADLEKYIKEGRILVGPWYVQNDFHLTSGEATVRNLLIGSKIANDFGKCTKVGYAADQFGLISQLPQIYAGFDIDNCIFGRGLIDNFCQFYWKSEDGSSVITEHMHHWYNNLQRLPSDGEAAYSFTIQRGDAYSAKTKTDNYLLMNGVDHLEAQEDLPKILEDMKPYVKDGEAIFQDTMPEYIERLKADVEKNDVKLPVREGELRDGGLNVVLTGTLASRVYLKQANVRVQTSLEGRFEPEYSYLAMEGLGKYPYGYSEYLWKTLINNHPHDSICGCSVDSVHRHMEDRSERLEENLTVLNARANNEYMLHLDRTGKSDTDVLLMCSNNTLTSYNGVLTATVNILTDEDKGGFDIKDESGKLIPYVILSVEKNIGVRIISPINLPGEKRVNRYKIAIKPGKLEGTSKKVLTLSLKEGDFAATENKRSHLSVLENEYLKVNVNKNGTVDITEKVSGKVYKNALLVEDNVDLGDSYRYHDSGTSQLVTNENLKAKCEVIYDNSLIKSVKISYTLKIDRPSGKGKLPVEITLTLYKGDRKLLVNVNLKNELNYHITRIRIPTGIMSDINYAGQPYDIVTRNKVSNFDGDKTHPNTDFCGIDGDGYGIAVLNEGLYDYEHMTDDEGTLALTLQRGTGRISGNAGSFDDSCVNEDWRAPECQCIGENTFNLAVYPYVLDHTSAEVAREAALFLNKPYVAVQHVDHNKFNGGRAFVQAAGVPEVFYRPLANADINVPYESTFVRLNENINGAMNLTALKAAEDGCGYILRLYNTTSECVTFSLRFGKKIKRIALTNLAETSDKELKAIRNTVNLCANKKQIITLRIEF